MIYFKLAQNQCGDTVLHGRTLKLWNVSQEAIDGREETRFHSFIQDVSSSYLTHSLPTWYNVPRFPIYGIVGNHERDYAWQNASNIFFCIFFQCVCVSIERERWLVLSKPVGMPMRFRTRGSQTRYSLYWIFAVASVTFALTWVLFVLSTLDSGMWVDLCEYLCIGLQPLSWFWQVLWCWDFCLFWCSYSRC